MSENRLSNPIDRYRLELVCIGTVAFAIIGIVPALLMPRGFIVTPVMTIFAALYFWGGYRKHVYLRPVFVIVRDDGLMLEFRSGKERFLHWSDIKDIYSKPGPKETKSDRGIGTGAIHVNGQRTIYLVTFEIATASTEQYAKMTGRPPMIWVGKQHVRYYRNSFGLQQSD